MKNISKKQIFIYVLFIITSSVCAFQYIKDYNANTIIPKKYRLIISTTHIKSVKIDNLEINDKLTIKKAITLLSNKTTTIASISNYPVNATDILKMEFIYSDKKTKTLTLYKKGKNYFIEEPYNGIYKVKEEQYKKIANLKNG